MALIPLMMRLAPNLGMVDYPDARKVHVLPIPRVGGIGIVIGTLIPVLLWLPLDNSIIAYLAGAVIMLIFGIWDDRGALGHRIKFIGQFIAALTVVYYGDIHIATLPFMGLDPLHTSISKPFTVFAIVGMINALNVSDGLDGLAGGLSILSLGCIAYLAFQADGYSVVIIAVATLGGVLGFLRYNTHPARVFMGDSGSQFLGFTLGYLAVFLIQKTNPALSPVLPLLFLGLPIIDIFVAMTQRIYFGISPFVATKHHIHHRLLDIGFDHYEAVVIIYSIQSLLVVSAPLLSYESDGLIFLFYAAICALGLIFLFLALHYGWQVHKSHSVSGLTRFIQYVKKHKVFTQGPIKIVQIAVPTFFIAVSVLSHNIPREFGFGSAILALILVGYLIIDRPKESFLLRAIAYITSAFAVYLETMYMDRQLFSFETLEITYFVVLVLAISLTVRFAANMQFKTTPMDFLIIFIVIAAGFISSSQDSKTGVGLIMVKLVILFYGCELIIAHMKSRWHYLNIGTLVTLIILASKGLLLP